MGRDHLTISSHGLLRTGPANATSIAPPLLRTASPPLPPLLRLPSSAGDMIALHPLTWFLPLNADPARITGAALVSPPLNVSATSGQPLPPLYPAAGAAATRAIAAGNTTAVTAAASNCTNPHPFLTLIHVGGWKPHAGYQHTYQLLTGRPIIPRWGRRAGVGTCVLGVGCWGPGMGARHGGGFTRVSALRHCHSWAAQPARRTLCNRPLTARRTRIAPPARPPACPPARLPLSTRHPPRPAAPLTAPAW